MRWWWWWWWWSRPQPWTPAWWWLRRGGGRAAPRGDDVTVSPSTALSTLQTAESRTRETGTRRIDDVDPEVVEIRMSVRTSNATVVAGCPDSTSKPTTWAEAVDFSATRVSPARTLRQGGEDGGQVAGGQCGHGGFGSGFLVGEGFESPHELRCHLFGGGQIRGRVHRRAGRAGKAGGDSYGSGPHGSRQFGRHRAQRVRRQSRLLFSSRRYRSEENKTHALAVGIGRSAGVLESLLVTGRFATMAGKVGPLIRYYGKNSAER